MTATPTALKDSKIYSEIARRGLTQRCRPFSPDVMALYTQQPSYSTPILAGILGRVTFAGIGFEWFQSATRANSVYYPPRDVK